MFMRNNIAFLLWKFCGLRSRRDRHNASYAQRRQIFFYGLATWTLRIASHRISLSVEFAVLTARFVLPTQRISKRERGERSREIWCGYVNADSISVSVSGFSCCCSASAASVLHANCFMANWNWFNNKFNLSLSIFDTHTWAHNNNHFLQERNNGSRGEGNGGHCALAETSFVHFNWIFPFGSLPSTSTEIKSQHVLFFVVLFVVFAVVVVHFFIVVAVALEQFSIMRTLGSRSMKSRN